LGFLLWLSMPVLFLGIKLLDFMTRVLSAVKMVLVSAIQSYRQLAPLSTYIPTLHSQQIISKLRHTTHF